MDDVHGSAAAAEGVAAKLYEALLLIRSTETRMEELRVAQGGGDFMAKPCAGWDAFVAPVCAALLPVDASYSADSPYTAYVARGGNLSRLISEMLDSYAFDGFAPARNGQDASATHTGRDAHFMQRVGAARRPWDSRPFLAVSADELAASIPPGASVEEGITVFFASDRETSPEALAKTADAHLAAGKNFLAYYYVTDPCAKAAGALAETVCRSERRYSDALRQGGAIALYKEAAREAEAVRDKSGASRIVALSALPPRGAEAPFFGRDYLTSCFYRWQARDPLAELAGSIAPETLKDIIFRVQDNVRFAESHAETSPHPPRHTAYMRGAMR